MCIHEIAVIPNNLPPITPNNRFQIRKGVSYTWEVQEVVEDEKKFATHFGSWEYLQKFLFNSLVVNIEICPTNCYKTLILL